MQSLEVINYMDAKEIAGILAMNGYLTTVQKLDYSSYTVVGRAQWKVSYTKEGILYKGNS